MSFTRAQWSRDFLVALGNANPFQSTIDWVVGWTCHESSTNTGALYNLLNTTQKTADSTEYNSVGVQNYSSYQEGVDTNASVLGENFPGYAALKQALLTNDLAALDGPSPSPGVLQGLDTWCGGCGYGQGFQALGASHLNDTFTYGIGGSELIPEGWTDDPTNKVLTAPNGVTVSSGFYNFVTGQAWDPSNVPLAADYEAAPLTSARPNFGDGRRQDFSFSSVGWTEAIGHEFFLPLGEEFAALKAQPPAPQGEPLADAAKAAIKAWLAS